MTGRLEGKVALITGTAGGQGRAAAIRFAAEGARVVGCDRQTEGAEETVALVESAGGKMVSQAPVDLSDEAAVEGWIDFAVGQFGDFDILYNNASGARFGPVEQLSREDWDYTLANELTLVFLATKYAVPVFRRRGGGCIINTASIAGMVGGGAGAFPANIPGALAHSVTKAGVIALTQVLACELAPLSVRVNAISPGAINTPGLAPILGDPENPFRKLMEASQLIRRPGQAAEVAALAAHLASDEASFITGSNFVIDGGRIAGGGAGQPGSAFPAEMALMGAINLDFN